jgi:hypothetical protein
MARHINNQKARGIAYAWHGGMSSPLYAFASSGLIANHAALLHEIRTCEGQARTVTDKRNCHALFRFARDCVARGPDTRFPFIAPWAKGQA